MPRILGLDLSSKSGWAILNNDKIEDRGLIRVQINDFNILNHPERSKFYPQNILSAADEMGVKIEQLIKDKNPDFVVIENTTRSSKNRGTQRILEWIHKSVLDKFVLNNWPIHYLDVSEWRKILNIRMSKEDKKNNANINKGKKKSLGLKGKITSKHLSVRFVNEKHGLSLLQLDNDQADAVCLAMAYKIKYTL